MQKHQQLSLDIPPTESDYINRINSMMKDLDKEIRQYPAGSLERIPFFFEKRRLLRIKQRIEREGIYN
ncbi:hypothetical protein BX659_1395 [Orenia metallireducens]|uniref:Uncharacterized protein n=1 Tax=Orenia metallireducens TaxID=1413210 RepID=A0A285IH57_9FIRM|nr:hypothetical protein [Orenia metallireducens]PRX19224.1 hypothetical protein BX659_1395 [Orenia metallireducens]SNY46281.1 hypothetical protein SAMN06265827_14125 [Orenia metallireducens]